jgi:hypothetical protein
MKAGVFWASSRPAPDLILRAMKTAYELAMERLGKGSPPVKLTPEQKAALAELDARYRAKTAEREIALQGEQATAQEKGDFEAMEKAQQQLVADRKKLQAELEEKKEQIRKAKA